ncbi:transposase-like zinc-binding domain-containing protein [Photobacterium phosphoreum]|uniref:IS1/IS1595 family N-terminal zinc-binding domain-containing protein n=1 Tax=Photobacterium phosphoreum TaxID=659 RepID=UPI003B9851F7
MKDEPKILFDRIEENFCSHPHYSHCNSTSNNKWGKQANKQRFKCINCKKTFISFSSPLNVFISR